VTVAESYNGGAGSPSSPLIITRRYTVTDAAGTSASTTQTITVIDSAPPIVTASLTPIGQVNQKEGRFRIGFSATDNCLTPSTLAVMEIPTGTEGFEIEFELRGGEEATVKFDIEKRRITLEGSDEAAMRSLLAKILAEGGVVVTQGQELRLHLEEKPRFEFIFSGGVLIREKAPQPSLKVTARDAAGNQTTATATAVFGRSVLTRISH